MVNNRNNDFQHETFVLLDDRSTPQSDCVLYRDPVEIIQVFTPDQVEAGLAVLQGAAGRGLHGAGYLSYELGYLLEPSLSALFAERKSGLASGGMPLMWIGLFASRQSFPSREFEEFFAIDDDAHYRVGEVSPSIGRERYLDDVARIKEYLIAGDVYQVNYTFDLHFDFTGDGLAFYRDLRRKQKAAHGAIIWTPDFKVLSASPEMFVHIDERHIKARPMKGTLPRSVDLKQDQIAKLEFRKDSKTQAENLMIVDLLRNDIGRIAEIGSVKVTDLFQIETYPTLHQMTSTIEATLRDDITVRDVIAQTFPCGSVTGAPKVRAMEIIHELEARQRGVYTGSIGAFDADGAVHFNVAIRTVCLQGEGFREGVMGIGSAIIYDSDNQAEYEECLLKAKFLHDPARRFRLLETLLWHHEDGLVLLYYHLKRLSNSARYFGFVCQRDAVEEALHGVEKPVGHDLRIRLLLDEYGEIEVQAFALEPTEPESVLRCVLWADPVDSANVFLYHKTTERQMFEDALSHVQQYLDAQEVLFINQRGELTEASRSNIFIERGNIILTPPVSCGLLDGTLRQKLLADGLYDGMPVRQSVLYPDDLISCDAIYLGNSVRGMQRVSFAG